MVASNPTFRDLTWTSGSLLTRTCAAKLSAGSPNNVRLPLSNTTFLVHISLLGLITKLPRNETTLNGFTFSTLDANG